MTQQPNLVVRDATLADIESCMELDMSYHTEHVWQMTMREELHEINITLRKQRLPRPLDAEHITDMERLRHTLDKAHCYIVIVESTTSTVIGYLSMRTDPTYKLAYIHDVVVDMPYRRQKMGARLINIAQLWANEHQLKRIIMEVPTTNYPTIEFAKAHGFTFSGFNDQYLPNQEIALFFTLAL